MTKEDKPEQGKQYLLIGGSDKPSIANGNSWEESEVKEIPIHEQFGMTVDEWNASQSAWDVLHDQHGLRGLEEMF